MIIRELFDAVAGEDSPWDKQVSRDTIAVIFVFLFVFDYLFFGFDDLNPKPRP